MIRTMTAATAARSRRPLDAAVDAALAAYLADGTVVGVSLAITDRDGDLVQRVGGWADIAAQRPVEPSSLFEIGSIGKTFAADIVLQLEAEGRLAVDDPVARHLPWFRVPRTGDRITLHHLLSHTGGITAGVDGTPEATFAVWRLRDLPPGGAPGRRFHYSNVGYKALGLIVEAIEGEAYPAVVQRRVLEPLGMAGSEPAITNDIRPRLAIGYDPARDDRPWADGDPIAPATWLETGTADGAIASTATDMTRYVRALMGDPAGRTTRMATPVMPAAAIGESYGYGYGLMRYEIDGRQILGHGGGMVGYTAGMAWDEAAGIGAVVLQSGPGGAPHALSRLLIRQARAAVDGRDPAAESMQYLGLGDDPGDTGGGVATDPTPHQAIAVGAWRSHDPWTPFFRIEARGTDLWLVFPWAPDGFDDEQILVPMARGWYRVGADRGGPERLRFDTVIDGLARRAWLSGWDYYRVDP
jgi:CubicO group peptidase (beta-lactamase class C family)